MSVIKDHKAVLVGNTIRKAGEVIQRLQDMGWLKPLQVDAPSGTNQTPELYLLDMEAREGEITDPLEVLQGYKPQGVLCYFGVLGHLGLTTQIAPFYHVAYMDKSPLAPVRSAVSHSGTTDDVSSRRNALGQEVFRFEGSPCYVTKRNIALVPGIQTRIIGPRTMLRMTSTEQALLDALGYPLHCGGESVVFEVWERGAALWNPDRLANYLQMINRPEIDRRVGAMMDALQIKCDSTALQARLGEVKAQLSSSQEEVSLLPGFTYPGWNPTWRVRVP